MVHLAVFKCIDCGVFTYSIASSMKGQYALCRRCGKTLSARCAENENEYLPKGYKAFSSTENAIQHLLAQGCPENDLQNLIAEPSCNTSNEVISSKSTQYFVRFCDKCGKHFYYSGTIKVCPEQGHLIDVAVPVKNQFVKEIDAMRECMRLNRLNQSSHSEQQNLGETADDDLSQSILLEGYYYSQNEIHDFHERVYRTWNIKKIFTFGKDGTVGFERAYLAYLNGFPDGSEYKRIYKSRRQILSKLSEIADWNQRFYFYLHNYNLLGENIPLCWKIGNKCVCYENVDRFVMCFLGRDIYNLTHDQMYPMINAQTKKFFFFPQNDAVDDEGELNDLRFTSLIMTHTSEHKLLYKNLNYPSLKAFLKKMNAFDDKIGEKYDFIQTLLRHKFEGDVEFLISKIFNRAPFEIIEPDFSTLENVCLTDGDKYYLPEWRDLKKLTPYLALCYYHCANNAGVLNVFQTDLGSDCNELISSIKTIVDDAYKNQNSKSYMRKFAVLRLCFLSGIIEAIDGVSLEISNSQSLIGQIKQFFDNESSGADVSEGSFENLLSKAYILTLNASERNQAPFVYDGISRSLREHILAMSDNIDDLKKFWNSNEVQNFVNYVLNGNSNGVGYQSREQIQEAIDDVYRQCSDIETRLNKQLDEINSKYVKTISVAEPVETVAPSAEHSRTTPITKRTNSKKTPPVESTSNNDDSDW